MTKKVFAQSRMKKDVKLAKKRSFDKNRDALRPFQIMLGSISED